MFRCIPATYGIREPYPGAWVSELAAIRSINDINVISVVSCAPTNNGLRELYPSAWAFELATICGINPTT